MCKYKEYHKEMEVLFNKAQNCALCHVNGDIVVPYFEPRNGSKNVKIMFINERPGRVGPGESNLVSQFNDDPSARTFLELFLPLNIKYKDIFITNSCLCYLPNRPVNIQHPTTQEIENCHDFLNKQINIANPKLIITIGKTALESIKKLDKFKNSKQLQNFTLSYDIGSVISDTNPKIYPLYHTARMGQIHRPKQKQKEDWKKIAQILKIK